MAAPLQLGRLALDAPLSFNEQLGDPVANLGGAVVPGDRAPLKAQVGIATFFATIANDDLAHRQRVRRQLRAMMNNGPYRLSGWYLQYADDNEQNGWYVPDQGTLADGDGSSGVATGFWKEENVPWYLVGHRRTHRRAHEIYLKDRRLSTTPRDYLKQVYSTDFASLTALALTYLPGMLTDGLNSVSAVPVAVTLQTPGNGAAGRAVGLTDGGVVSFEQADASQGLGDVVIYDTRSSASDPTPISNCIPNPNLGGTGTGDTTGYGVLSPTWLNSGAALSAPTMGGTGIPNVSPGAGKYLRVAGNGGSTFEGTMIACNPPLGDSVFKANVKYTFSFYALANSGTGTQLALQFIVADTAHSSNASPANVNLTTGGWVRYAVEWTPTVDAPQAWCIVRNTNAVTFDWAFAALMLTKSSSASNPAYFDGSFPSANWVGSPQRSVSIQGQLTNVNYIANPSAAYGTAPWTGAGNAYATGGASTLSQDFTKSGDGTSALAVATTAVSQGASIPATVIGDARSKTFYVTFQAWVPTGMTLTWLLADTGGAYDVNGANVVGNGAWQTITQQIVWIGSAASGSFNLLLISSVTSGTFYVRKVQANFATYTYIDGDQAGCSWLGTPGNSVSVQSPSPQDDWSWEEVYGPDQPLTSGTVPVITNGLCRVRYDATNTPGFKVDVYDTTAMAWAEQCKVNANRYNGAWAVVNTLVSASVVEWTPERGVIQVVMTASSDAASREVLFIVLQRGWQGPRFEAYPAPRANGTKADLTFIVQPVVVDTNTSALFFGTATPSIQATAGSGSTLYSGVLQIAGFSGTSENEIVVLREGAPYAIVLGYVSSTAWAGAYVDYSTDGVQFGAVNGYGVARNSIGVAPSGTGAAYSSVQLGFPAEQTDQMIEAESFRFASGTTSQVADATASGGQCVRDTQTAQTAATLLKANGNMRTAKYRMLARVRTNGGTGNFHGFADVTGLNTAGAWQWIDLGEAIQTFNTPYGINAWRGTATSVDIDRVELFKLEDRTDTVPRYDGGRDLGQSVLYDARTVPSVVTR